MYCFSCRSCWFRSPMDCRWAPRSRSISASSDSGLFQGSSPPAVSPAARHPVYAHSRCRFVCLETLVGRKTETMSMTQVAQSKRNTNIRHVMYASAVGLVLALLYLLLPATQYQYSTDIYLGESAVAGAYQPFENTIPVLS